MLKLVVAAVIAALVVTGLQFAQHRQHQVVPAIAAPTLKAAPAPVPLPKAKPKIPLKAPVHKPAAKPVAVDCSLVDWAKSFYNKETLKEMGKSHPAEAQAAKVCQ